MLDKYGILLALRNEFNEEIIKGQIKELVRGSVEETLNELLEAGAQKLTQAARYERSEARQGYRSATMTETLLSIVQCCWTWFVVSFRMFVLQLHSTRDRQAVSTFLPS